MAILLKVQQHGIPQMWKRKKKSYSFAFDIHTRFHHNQHRYASLTKWNHKYQNCDGKILRKFLVSKDPQYYLILFFFFSHARKLSLISEMTNTSRIFSCSRFALFKAARKFFTKKNCDSASIYNRIAEKKTKRTLINMQEWKTLMCYREPHSRRVFFYSSNFNSKPSYVINVGMLDVYIAKHNLSRYNIFFVVVVFVLVQHLDRNSECDIQMCRHGYKIACEQHI